MGAEMAAGLALQKLTGLQGQIHWRARLIAAVALTGELTVAAQVNRDGIRQGHQTENGFKQVIAVRATANHMQKQVQLRWGWQIVERHLQTSLRSVDRLATAG
jgi:hypothetical protein